MKKVLILALFGLTLAGEAQPLPKIELRPVFPALKAERPVWMTEAPDGSRRQFIVYQSGKILVVHPGSNGADAKEFLNIEDRHPDFENECGLLSLAFHPGFATNRLFYIYYTQKNSPDQNSRPLNFPFRSVISEFKTAAGDPDRADLATERPLLEVPQPYGNHKGGQISFGPDGYLYIVRPVDRGILNHLRETEASLISYREAAASRSRIFHLIVPEPARSPLCQPFSIGPPESTIAGMLTVAAAIRQAGVVLSQPVVSTTPSSG